MVLQNFTIGNLGPFPTETHIFYGGRHTECASHFGIHRRTWQDQVVRMVEEFHIYMFLGFAYHGEGQFEEGRTNIFNFPVFIAPVFQFW